MRTVYLSALVVLCSILLFSCDSNTPRPVANSNGDAANLPSRPQTAIAHSSEKQTPPSNAAKGAWSQSGEAFDTSALDKAVTVGEKGVATKPDDDAAKKALAKAYYDRAVALTDKRQYASALGDYRRTLKYDPSNADAKEWIDKIVMIYESLGRSAPKEGEEPPPLPVRRS